MLNKKENKIVIGLDIVQLILLFFTLIVFTFVYKIVAEPVRYVFLLGDVFLIYGFSKTLESIEKHLRITK